uniref:DUF148 domain-containing protein n=1 Tax=Angiostrongylus cantonensis TaxID=6313 RepID=A0A0K0CUK5_ANGCA
MLREVEGMPWYKPQELMTSESHILFNILNVYAFISTNSFHFCPFPSFHLSVVPTGCLPFLSEFMQVAYGNCQRVADEKAFDAWGDELKSAIYTGQIDLLKASQETCRRGAERQQCGALRRAISNCDIMESLQIGAQMQRAMKRCEEMTGLLDQNPLVILGQINKLVGGELAQGFLNKFLSGGK